MQSKGKTDKDLWFALEQLDDDLLDPNIPKEIVEDELRKLGLDPEEVAKSGLEFINQLQERERLSWQTKARAQKAALEDRVSGVKVSSDMGRKAMHDRLDELRKEDPNLRYAARNRSSEESSDEDLRAHVEEAEMLRAMKDK
jgi:hypothetical protein